MYTPSDGKRQSAVHVCSSSVKTTKSFDQMLILPRYCYTGSELLLSYTRALKITFSKSLNLFEYRVGVLSMLLSIGILMCRRFVVSMSCLSISLK